MSMYRVKKERKGKKKKKKRKRNKGWANKVMTEKVRNSPAPFHHLLFIDSENDISCTGLCQQIPP